MRKNRLEIHFEGVVGYHNCEYGKDGCFTSIVGQSRKSLNSLKNNMLFDLVDQTTSKCKIGRSHQTHFFKLEKCQRHELC